MFRWRASRTRCAPGSSGSSSSKRSEIVGLIRDNAQMLGLRLADSQTCDPNVIVAVMDDPQGFLKGLVKKRPYLLQELDKRQRERLLAVRVRCGAGHVSRCAPAMD